MKVGNAPESITPATITGTSNNQAGVDPLHPGNDERMMTMMIRHCVEDGCACEHLQKRTIRVQVPMDSGVWIDNGHRFYCAKYDRWFQINMKDEDMEFQPCVK